ncbi:MAG: hypothetical protein AAB909_03775 [Patescibacteria group bacterium]
MRSVPVQTTPYLVLTNPESPTAGAILFAARCAVADFSTDAFETHVPDTIKELERNLHEHQSDLNWRNKEG